MKCGVNLVGITHRASQASRARSALLHSEPSRAGSVSDQIELCQTKSQCINIRRRTNLTKIIQNIRKCTSGSVEDGFNRRIIPSLANSSENNDLSFTYYRKLPRFKTILEIKIRFSRTVSACSCYGAGAGVIKENQRYYKVFPLSGVFRNTNRHLTTDFRYCMLTFDRTTKTASIDWSGHVTESTLLIGHITSHTAALAAITATATAALIKRIKLLLQAHLLHEQIYALYRYIKIKTKLSIHKRLCDSQSCSAHKTVSRYNVL